MNGYINGLTRIFKGATSKHEAHRRSWNVLGEISADPAFVTAILQKHLSKAEVLNAKNYPVVALDIELNPHYHLVANCWIPLPGGETNVPTKAIHHHGDMLLTTATVFGPGYEHWLFTQPIQIDPARELYDIRVTERRLHSLHDVAFVDAYIPHLPVYPASLTITLALWSGRGPTTWRDHLKRIPILKQNETALKRLALHTGLARGLDLKVVEYFDFFPVESGFKAMKERIEFKLGPNEDYLQSLFHVIQQTGNDGLAPIVEQQLESDGGAVSNRQIIKRLLRDLKSGRPVAGRLSDCHLTMAPVTFTTEDIERATTPPLETKVARPPATTHISR